MDKLSLNEQRCKCGRLLLKGIFFDGIIEIKCKKCGKINEIGNEKKVNGTGSYLLIVNTSGFITNASGGICDILGYRLDELIGKHFNLINPTLPKEIVNKFIGTEGILNEENYFQLDTFHQSKKGIKIPIVCSLKLYKPTNEEKSILVLVKLKNFIDKKNLAPLSKNSVKFLDNSCDFYFYIDKNGLIEYESLFTEKLLGFSQGEIMGKNFFDFFTIEKKIENFEKFEHFSTKEQPFRIMNTIINSKHDKKICNDLYFTPNYNDKGNFVGYNILGWILKKS